MKKNLTILFCLCIYLTNGQTQFKQGENINSERKINYSLKTSITENGEIINLSCGKRQSALSFKTDNTLSHYDKDLNIIKEKNLSKEIKGSILDLQVINNIINIIVAEPHELRMKSVKRYYCPIDEFKFQEQVLYENKGGSGAAKMSFSKNKDYFSLIIGEKKVKRPDVYFSTGNEVILFNNNFEIESKINIENKLTSENHEISDIYALDGKVSLVLIRENKKKNRSIFSYKLLKVTEDSSEILDIDTKNKFVHDLKLFEKNNTIFFAGHYSNYDKPEDLKGFYISSLNLQSFNQTLIKIKPFNENYISDINQHILRKKFKQLKYLEIFDFYIINNFYYFINESSYSNTVTEGQRANTGMAISTSYHGNMSINKFDIEGSLIEYDVIYKEITNNYFYPYQSPSVSIKKNNQIHIFLNSSKVEKEGQVIYKYSQNPISCFEFKYDHLLNKEIIENNDILFNPINAFNYNNNYLILFTRHKEKRGLMKIMPN